MTKLAKMKEKEFLLLKRKLFFVVFETFIVEILTACTINRLSLDVTIKIYVVLCQQKKF